MYSSRAILRRRLAVRLLATLGAFVLGILVAPAARASDGFPIDQSFTGTTAPGWQLGGVAALTAPGTDANGNGWLRLTPVQTSANGYAFYDTAFSSTKGASVEFDYATYGGTGADGLTFFLYDGATTAGQFQIGAFGGSLGYVGCGGNPGLNNAYIGVGFDEFGNFTNLASCGADGNTAHPNYVTVRGSEATNYAMLTSTSVPGGLTGDRSSPRHVTISVTPDGKLTVTIRFPNGTFQTVTSNYQLPAAPSTLKLGYAASTGGSTNIHEIRNTHVVKPTDLTTTVTDGVAGSSRASGHTWTATVTNNGPNPTESESLTATTGAQSLTNVTWSCVAAGGADCGATTSGTGLPSAVSGAAMPIGSSLTYTITGDPAAGTDYAQMTVAADPTGDTGDLAPTDNSATDTTDLTPIIPGTPSFTLNSGGTATATLSTPVLGGNITTTRQWQRCDPDGSNCVDIVGQTGATYSTTVTDRGKTIRLHQISTNAAGTTTADSAVYGPLPTTAIATKPAAISTSTSANFTFTSTNGSGYECRLDGGSWASCPTPKSLTGLADGSHTFDVRAIYGGLSDPTPPSWTWTVDATAPNTSITVQPTDPSQDATPSISFTGTDGSGTGVASYECKLDSGSWGACSSPEALGPLADGSHTFQVRAIDGAGNTDAMPATYTWVLDTAAPTTTITAQPASQESTGTADFSFTGNDGSGTGVASYECRLDGGSWSACTSPRHLTGLADGDHTFEVRAIDMAGTADPTPASYTWHVDTTGPQPPAITAPDDGSVTANRRPPLRFTAEPGAQLAITLDGQVIATVTVPGDGKVEYTPLFDLLDGDHAVSAIATDGLGNTGSASATHAFRVLATVPTPPVIPTLPAPQSSDKNPVFAFDPPAGTTLQCQLDDGTWGACEKVTALAGLSDGEHTLRVRAVNEAGVQSEPQLYSWVVDTTAPPAPPFVRQPDDRTQQTGATFELSLEPSATAQCSIDGGPFVDCSKGLDLKALSLGIHKIVAKQTDAAGNTSGETAYRWLVGATGKGGTPTHLTATLAGKAVVRSGGRVTIGCTLDRGSLKICAVGAYARVGGKRFLVGTGRGVVAEQGHRYGTVKVKLNAVGRRLARQRLKGLPVSLVVTGTPFGYHDLGAKLRSRFYAARLDALPLIWPFDSDESLLSGSGHRTVVRIANQVHKATHITCVGHTDSQGSASHNLSLGLHRARVACAALRRSGVPATMGAQSWGESRPRATNRTAEGRRLNRRVELIVRY